MKFTGLQTVLSNLIAIAICATSAALSTGCIQGGQIKQESDAACANKYKVKSQIDACTRGTEIAQSVALNMPESESDSLIYATGMVNRECLQYFHTEEQQKICLDGANISGEKALAPLQQNSSESAVAALDAPTNTGSKESNVRTKQLSDRVGFIKPASDSTASAAKVNK